MDGKLKDAFEYLTPSNQTLVAAIIFELANKEKELHNVTRELLQQLESKKENEDER